MFYPTKWDCYRQQYKRVLRKHVYDSQDETSPSNFSHQTALSGMIPRRHRGKLDQPQRGRGDWAMVFIINR